MWCANIPVLSDGYLKIFLFRTYLEKKYCDILIFQCWAGETIWPLAADWEQRGNALHIQTIFSHIFPSNCHISSSFQCFCLKLSHGFLFSSSKSYLLFKNILNFFVGCGTGRWVENIKDPLMIRIWRNEMPEMKILFIIHICEKIPRNRNGTTEDHLNIFNF